MKILFDNCYFSSSTGPNQFGLFLARQFANMGHILADPDDFDTQLSFIYKTNNLKPTCLRLDGIWFWKDKDWKTLNKPISDSYRQSEAVVIQSHFDQQLVNKYFGEHPNIHLIYNGAPIVEIEKIKPMDVIQIDQYEEVWCCASQSIGRPHKRLNENIRYFLECANEKTVLIIAGSVSKQISHPRIFYADHLDWKTLIGLYKRCNKFLHLAFADHCPNTVIHARACGCQIVCASSGGTKEIAGSNAIVIQEDEWDFEPINSNTLPYLDFSRIVSNESYTSELDLKVCAEKYVSVFKTIS